MQTLHYDEVADRLYVGSYPQSPEDVRYLKDELGVTAVLSLQDDDDHELLGIRWDLLGSAYRRAGLLAIREPIEDFSPKALRKRLDDAVAALERLHSSGHRVYLHCTAGVNRSPTVAIAWLHRHGGLSVEDAVAQVTERHPCQPYDEVIRSIARL